MTSTPGDDFAAAAVALVGTPFRLHGRDPATGLDCVGLVAAALEASGRAVIAPHGYRLRALSVAPLLRFAAANGFVPRADDDSVAPGDLLLAHPSPLQAHLLIATDGGGFVHAHAGLGRVVREAGPAPWPVAARWRLATKG